jgi:iron(II)-dependent oxidoreductase
MHDASVTAAAHHARSGLPADLAAALQASRADTLATFAVYERHLSGLKVPLAAELNPPLWELGHIGWFQDFWLQRFDARSQGPRADPDSPRRAATRPEADALYNSSLVPHDSRWQLPLPDADHTRADLAAQLQANLALLADVDPQAPDLDDRLYFHRLVLLHEDMHHEAALYMAQALGLPIGDARWQPRTLPAPTPALAIEPGPWRLGREPGQGFAFDTELAAHTVALGATEIDAQAVRWAEFLPFVEAGGYQQARWWSAAGWAWRSAQQATAPRYLRLADGTWQQGRHGQWQALNPALAACHLTAHEAQAWCRWAGRRLPTEAEWERAACRQPEGFAWGDVWEWTASAFAPYPGFVAHPYRDYSAPWFDGRPVLRGASFMTQPRLRHPRYRNYFPAHRNDVPAGFRSCAV